MQLCFFIYFLFQEKDEGMLQVEQVSVKFGKRVILQDVQFSVKEKQWVMLIGPNGAGKSTLLQTIIQKYKYMGVIYWNGANIKQLHAKERARNIAMLAQKNYVNYAFSVEEVIKLGRYAYSSGFFADNKTEEIVKNAMELTGLTEKKDRSILTLSGGELQRTFLAQVLAQDAQLLLLDEPSNHLDFLYQKQIFELIQAWVQEKNRMVISAVHDLNLARAYGTHAILLHGGRIQSYGTCKQVLTRENLRQTYGLDVVDWMKELLSNWQEG